MHDIVEMAFDPNLVLVLDALGVRWQPGRPANGSAGTIRVAVNRNVDAQLEQLVGALSDLRWKYEPGRSLQLSLDLGPGSGGQYANH